VDLAQFFLYAADMDNKAEQIALFRYGLIAPLVLETLPRGELTRRAQEVASRLYDMPHSKRRQFSVDTLLEWTLCYRREGLDGLTPKTRKDRGQMRALTAETAKLIEKLKRENPSRTGVSLLQQLALESSASSSSQQPPSTPTPTEVSPSTLYRFLRANGLTERQLLREQTAAASHKKYEAQHANQIWQSDMLFGPWVERPGGGKQQVFLQAILDDASRLIPHAQFYPDQGLQSFLDCLRQAVTARGLPTRLYMDNAKIYRSPQLARITASIGILIVHTPPFQPEGRGKIERFFRSVREQFLNSIQPAALRSIEQLNEHFWHWIEHVYHRREHSSLATTPLLRWQRDIAQIRQLPPSSDLRRLFLHRVDRMVRRDSTFMLHGRFFEAPPGLAGQRIEVRFDPFDYSLVEIHHNGQYIGAARLVDAVVNGRTYR
jgi:putative transposase